MNCVYLIIPQISGGVYLALLDELLVLLQRGRVGPEQQGGPGYHILHHLPVHTTRSLHREHS